MKPDDAPLGPAGARPWPVTQRRAGHTALARDQLVEEVPVALVFNGISHAVMLATPLALEDFALGFGLTEGLLASPSELYGVELRADPDGIVVDLEVAAACEMRLKQRRRTMAGRTGCGLCGTESLAQVRRSLPVRAAGGDPATGPTLAPAAVARALRGLHEAQTLQQATGAVHAAAWCGIDGQVLQVREDVGRHNALDKLVGAMVRAGVDPAQGFVCVTSRASFEMVQKSVLAGVQVLVAVSAATALAAQMAEAAGLTLAGFAREDDLVAYSHPWRLGLAPSDGVGNEGT